MVLLAVSGCAAAGLLVIALQSGPEKEATVASPTHIRVGFVRWQREDKTERFIAPVTRRLSTYPGLRADHRILAGSLGEEAALRKAIEHGEFNVLVLSPLRFVILRRTLDLDPFLMLTANKASTYDCVICVRAESPFRSLADLRGRKVGFLRPESASGYLFPRFAMLQAGIDPDAPPLSGIVAVKDVVDHTDMVARISAFALDAGGTYAANCTGPELRVLARTETLPMGVLALAPGVPPGDREAIRRGFARLAAEIEGDEYSLYDSRPTDGEPLDGFARYDAAAFDEFERRVGRALRPVKLVMPAGGHDGAEGRRVPGWFRDALEAALLRTRRFEVQVPVDGTEREAESGERWLVTLDADASDGDLTVHVRVTGPHPATTLKATAAARPGLDRSALDREVARVTRTILRAFPISGYLIPVNASGDMGLDCGRASGVVPGMTVKVDGIPAERVLGAPGDIGDISTRIPRPAGMSNEAARGRLAVLEYPEEAVSVGAASPP